LHRLIRVRFPPRKASRTFLQLSVFLYFKVTNVSGCSLPVYSAAIKQVDRRTRRLAMSSHPYVHHEVPLPRRPPPPPAASERQVQAQRNPRSPWDFMGLIILVGFLWAYLTAPAGKL